MINEPLQLLMQLLAMPGRSTLGAVAHDDNRGHPGRAPYLHT